MIDENKISTLKTKINTLGNILKKCDFDKTKLEAMFSKKNSSKRHIHATHAHSSESHAKHTHEPYAHLHSCMVEFIHVLIVVERVT